MNDNSATHRRPSGHLSRALARWWSRRLDGEYAWGSIDIWPSRHGVRRYRLVMFPPGISVAERRLLRLRRAWPAWGAGLWLVSAICLAGTPTPVAAIGISTIAYLAAGAITFAFTAHLRSRVRTLHVLVIDSQPDGESTAAYRQLETLVKTLCDADTMLSQGQLTPVDHEAVCWRVYDRLAPVHPRPVDGHLSI